VQRPRGRAALPAAGRDADRAREDRSRDLERALELQRERGDKLGKILVDMGLVAQRDVLAALSEQLDVPLVTIDGPPPAAPEIEGLSYRFLRQSRAFPVALNGSVLTVAMADPMDFETAAAIGLFPVWRFRRRWRPSRKSSTRVDKHYAMASARCCPGTAETRRRWPISSTCATWPAKRR